MLEELYERICKTCHPHRVAGCFFALKAKKEYIIIVHVEMLAGD